MTTYDTFKTQVRRQLEEPTEGVWSDLSLMYFTNEVALQIARRGKPVRDEVYTDTAANIYAYTLPVGRLETVNLFLDGDELYRMDYGDLSELDQTVTGKPTMYAIAGNVLHLFPTPDAVYPVRLFGYKVPAEITADTDSMPFDSQYNTAIEYGVLSRCFEQINDWQSAEMYRGRFEGATEEMLRQKILEKGARRSTSPREVY